MFLTCICLSFHFFHHIPRDLKALSLLLGSQSASDDAKNGHKVQQRKIILTAPTCQSHMFMEPGLLHVIVFVGGSQRDQSG